MTRIDLHETSPARVSPPAQLPLRERLIVWGGILTVAAILWMVLARMPMPVSGMNGRAISGITSTMDAGAVLWSLRDAWVIFAMWTVMMAAMMLPSATPMIEMYARIARGQSAERGGRAWIFAIGYLIAWSGYSAVMTGTQYALERTRIIADAMRMEPFAGGLLLIAAGI